MSPSRLLLVALGLFVANAACARALKRNEAARWLERARAHVDLSADGVPAFRMRATIDLAALETPGHDGELTWTFVSPEAWRLELEVGGLRQVRVADQRAWLVWSEPVKLPPGLELILDTIAASLLPARHLKLHEGERLQGHELSNGRIRLTMNSDRYRSRSAMLSATTAQPLRLGTSFDAEWSGEIPIGPCIWPKRMALSRANRLMAVLVFEREDDAAPIHLPTVRPPETARQLFGPSDDEVSYVAPKLIGRPRHRLPGSARRRDLAGTVVLRVRIGETGRVLGVQVEQSMGEVVDAEAVRVVKASRYKPARIDGRATEITIPVSLRFR